MSTDVFLKAVETCFSESKYPVCDCRGGDEKNDKIDKICQFLFRGIGFPLLFFPDFLA